MNTQMESAVIAPQMAVSAPGMYKWMVLFLGWSALVFTFVDRLAWGSVAVLASESFGLPLMALGVFVTAFFSGYVIANALGGMLTDRIGSRWMLTGTLIVLGTVTFCFSFTHGVALGIILQALMGLAAGADIAATVKLVTAWFGVRERGRAIGFLLTAAPASVMITNSLVPTLLKAIDWHAVYQLLGMATALFGALIYFTVREGPRLQKSSAVENVRLGPLLRNRQFILLLIAGFGGYWAVWGFTFIVNALMVKQQGLSPVAAGVIVVWFGAASLVSKPLVGCISDAMGGVRKPLMLAIMVIFAALMIGFAFLRNEFELTIGATALGFVALAWSPLMTATVAEWGGKSLVGAATGTANALWQGAGALSPAAAGLVFQMTHSFHAPFFLLAAGPIVSSIALLMVKDRIGVEGRSIAQ